MKSYIGAKIILGEPEAKDGKEGYKVIYPDGYESWSPKDAFEQAYRVISDGEVGLVLDIVAQEVLSDDEINEMFDGENPEIFEEALLEEVEIAAEMSEPQLTVSEG